MPSLVDSANAILLSAERRMEATANNVANASTPGFKRHVDFTQLLENRGDGPAGQPELQLVNDFTQGALSQTGNPLDLAIYGAGLLAMRDGDSTVYTRGGSFRLGEGGVLLDPADRVLQQAGGGDLVVSGNALEILDDGTVLEDGLPVASVGLFELASPDAARSLGGSLFAVAADNLRPAERSQLRQGFLEQSNVEMSAEMTDMMATIRRAEGGGRIMQFYDQAIGQAIQTFGRSGR